MLMYRQVWQPKTLDEAVELMKKQKWAPLLAGGCWIGLGTRKFPAVIDLSGLPLRYIKETEQNFHIGAMTTQGDVEQYEPFKTFGKGILPKSVNSILGVQFRNMATMGGSVAARFGFSDIIPSLLALDAKVLLHSHGEMTLQDYLTFKDRDILVEIIVPKKDQPVAALAFRKSVSDFPHLTGAISHNETGYHIYIGGRPSKPVEAVRAGQILTEQGIEGLPACLEALQDVAFQTNSHASASYRAAMAKVMVKRLVQEVSQWTCN
ncbi:FAD binding domain-containing protein [uncultured Veillonella sp.]|uniref:FAD binding domain-containing protein n=1 Tax=uncultured Veillonella sp. TaxID=159268 RepID=UPI0026038688|nr:FAD binding domain-containing protein [uncultured Veillonella sp.]